MLRCSNPSVEQLGLEPDEGARWELEPYEGGREALEPYEGARQKMEQEEHGARGGRSASTIILEGG